MRLIELAAGCLLVSGIAFAESAQKTVTGMAEVPAPAVYYEVAGQGSPVILIHGGQLDCRIWDDQFPVLARSHRVVRYDVRGFGRSPAATAPWSCTRDLLSLMDQLGIERATLVGLSLGGRIAIDFALDHPGRVAALVVAGPGLSGFDWSDDGRENYMKILAAAQAGDLEQAAELWLQSPYMAPAMENAALAARLRALARENARCWLDNPLLERDLAPPAAGRLGEIKAPTLVIVGERDIPDIQRIVTRIASDVPGARKIVVRGAGHMVNMEKPEDFTRALVDFLQARSGS